MNKIFKNKNKGFTLIELIVSLGLFTVVMMISTGALLSLSDTNKKVQSMRVAFDNLNFALESISREIRMGSVYTCNPPLSSPPLILSRSDTGSNCKNNGYNTIAFVSQDGKTVVYRLKNSIVQRSRDGGSNFSDLTSGNVVVNDLKFYVGGAQTSKNQPRVTILIKGTAGDKILSKFQVQTTITQRVPK